jgi:hypothetical protein
MLAAYGARHSIALGRRSVTHVVLGTANVHGCAGGGLAATKIQKEMSKSGGKAVKFITVEWYVLVIVHPYRPRLTYAGSSNPSKPTAASPNRAFLH